VEQRFYVLASLVEMSKQIRLGYDRSGFGVGNNKPDLLRLEQRVDRTCPGADLEAREVKDKVLGSIG